MGSGLRPDTWERFLRRFGPLQVFETYGLTEGNVATFNYTGQCGAVGRASWIYKVGSCRAPKRGGGPLGGVEDPCSGSDPHPRVSHRSLSSPSL